MENVFIKSRKALTFQRSFLSNEYEAFKIRLNKQYKVRILTLRINRSTITG